MLIDNNNTNRNSNARYNNTEAQAWKSSRSRWPEEGRSDG